MIASVLAITVLGGLLPLGSSPNGEPVKVNSRLTQDRADLQGWTLADPAKARKGVRGMRSRARPRVVRVYVPACPGNRPGVVGELVKSVV
jgi:hypothetical protein